MNVLNVRLHGHYDQDQSILRETVKWSDWQAQVDEAVSLAKELGDHVLLTGHSTGALLLTWTAIKDPVNIAALALFAPAFAVHPVASFGAKALYRMKLNLRTIDGRHITGYAGLQVEELARAFAKNASAMAAERLARVPVWMAHTESDLVIDRKAAQQFLRGLMPSDQPRIEYTVPLCRMIMHDQIIAPNTWAWSALLKSLDRIVPKEDRPPAL